MITDKDIEHIAKVNNWWRTRKEDINIPKNREDLNKRITKLIVDMCLRWREHFNSAAPVEFIESTASIIIGEVICYQLTKDLNEMEDL